MALDTFIPTTPEQEVVTKKDLKEVNEAEKTIEQKESYISLIDSWIKQQAITPFLKKLMSDNSIKVTNYMIRYYYVAYLHYKGIKLFNINKYNTDKIKNEKHDDYMKNDSEYIKKSASRSIQERTLNNLFYKNGTTYYIGQADQDKKLREYIKKNESKLRGLGVDDKLFE